MFNFWNYAFFLLPLCSHAGIRVVEGAVIEPCACVPVRRHLLYASLAGVEADGAITHEEAITADSFPGRKGNRKLEPSPCICDHGSTTTEAECCDTSKSAKKGSSKKSDEKGRRLNAGPNRKLLLAGAPRHDKGAPQASSSGGEQWQGEELPMPEKVAWTKPHAANAILVANDPGIWEIEGLFDEHDIGMLLEVIHREEAHFEGCIGGSHDHLELKECFYLSPTLPGLSEVDAGFVKDIRAKLLTLWPTNATQREYFYVQKTLPGCGPTEVHYDNDEFDKRKLATATVAIYLSDSEQSVVFPLVGVTVPPPRRGKVVTWLNVHSDGRSNANAAHGIQAMPVGEYNSRLAMTFRISLSDEELVLEAAEQAEA